MALTGVLAQRFNTRIEYDAANMKVSNHPELDVYIKEPVRKGWNTGKISGENDFIWILTLPRAH
jgi:hypothetical protein